jgi:hypothetical protein
MEKNLFLSAFLAQEGQERIGSLITKEAESIGDYPDLAEGVAKRYRDNPLFQYILVLGTDPRSSTSEFWQEQRAIAQEHDLDLHPFDAYILIRQMKEALDSRLAQGESPEAVRDDTLMRKFGEAFNLS